MTKQEKIGIGIFVAALLLLVWTEYTRETPTNWENSFEFNQKIPFGLYILKEEQKHLFPENETLEKSFYEIQHQVQKSKQKANYININTLSKLDKESQKSLLSFVKRGNSAFIASATLPSFLADTLGLSSSIAMKDNFFERLKQPNIPHQQIYTYLSDKSLHPPKYAFHRSFFHNKIIKFPKNKTTILGKTQNGSINFIRVQFGKGAFYFHLIPHAFTNYYLLNQNRRFATLSLSYLPHQKSYWQGKKEQTAYEGALAYVLAQPALRWGYYLMLGVVFLYLFVGGKRRQRPIPIVLPPKNDQLDFAKTLGRLYFQQGDHLDIAQKKATYFLEFVRTHYRLSTDNLDENFQKNLIQRSGADDKLVHDICAQINSFRNVPQIQAKTLVEFSKNLNAFYRH